jgi:hypothetical protein
MLSLKIDPIYEEVYVASWDFKFLLMFDSLALCQPSLKTILHINPLCST